MFFFDIDLMKTKQLFEGVTIKTVHGDRIMMSFVELEAGAIVPRHHHEHEQMGYIISGVLEFQIGAETKTCRAGDSYLAPSNIPHEAKVADEGPAKVLDIFSPPREEYK